MKDNTQPEAREFTMSQYASKDDMIGAMRKRIAELEAEIEAIDAGGVSGPLMGQPQAMPDLSQLTERGAKAWAGVDAQGLREGRWYMVTHDGVATLCEDRRDAEEEAKAADMAWPYSGPHRAVQLVESSMAGYTAADMATAASQGFRDGVASLAASAGEPWTGGEEWEALAWHLCAEENGEDACGELIWEGGPTPEPWGDRWMKYESDAKRMIELVRKFVAAPPTAQAEGWRPIETAPRDGTPIWLYTGAGQCEGYWNYGEWVQDAVSCTYDGAGGPAFQCNPTHWMPLPLPPTSAEGVEHG